MRVPLASVTHHLGRGRHLAVSDGRSSPHTQTPCTVLLRLDTRSPWIPLFLTPLTFVLCCEQVRLHVDPMHMEAGGGMAIQETQR